MTKFSITFKKSVAKDLRSIPNQDIKRIIFCIDALALNPRAEGCVKLSGQDRYRVRQGVSRIIYDIFEEKLIVTVVKVAHRSSIYQSN